MTTAFQRALAKAETLPQAAFSLDEAVPTPLEVTLPWPETVPAPKVVEAPEAPEAFEALPRKIPRWAFAGGAVALLALIGVILLAMGVLRGGEKPTPLTTASLPAVGPPTPLPTQTVVVTAGGSGIFVDSGEELGAAPTPTPMPTPMEPEEGKVVEVCEGVRPPQLCIRDVETRRVVKITDGLGFEVINAPAWSPDGGQIVFAAGSAHSDSEPHDHKLYVINNDGSDIRQITHGDTMDDQPDWSPDGEWIAFMRNGELWLVRPDGSDGQALLERTYNREAWMPKWSPDGQQFAFFNYSPSTLPEIWVVDRDGSDPRMVYGFERPLEDWEGWGWSPDGQQIAARYKEGGRWACLIANADGSGQVQRLDDFCPDPWSSGFWPK